MTSNKPTSAKLAALIKKTAQKIVKSPKQLQKLALTLPLLALFVEEVRAATGKGEAFKDLQALTEFVDEQNLTEEQYAQIEESLDGVELAANDISATDVVKAAQEEEEKALLLEREAAAEGKRKAGLLLEPSGDAAAGASGGIASEGSAAATGESVAAAASESSELAGLVIPVAPVPLIGAIATGLGIVAAGTGGTGVSNTETATGTTLSRTLKQLKTDGIVYVQPSTGNNVINVELGAGEALTSTTGITLFGDTDRNGAVSAAENAALQVNLIITSANQLAEVAALNGLTSYGIDSVRIDLSNQDLLNALTSDATLAADLAAIRATGLTVTTVDMGAAASITEAQAATLIDNGLSFATDDTITVAEAAGSTHLSTSLKDLHKLGVDAVSVSGVSNFSVDMGGLTSTDLATGGAVASFDEALDLTLNVASAAEYGVASGLAASLSAAHFDNVKLDIANSANALNDSLALQSTAAALHAQNISTILDIGGVGVAADLSLTAAQASSLVAQGISFASSDHITIQEAAHTTHLGTTLKDLHKLGVDAVSVTGAAVNDVLHINLGEGSSIDLAQGGLPDFNDNLNVTLHAGSASQLNELGTLANTAGVDLGALGIDQIQLDLANQDALDALFGSPALLNSAIAATAPVTTLEGAVAAVRADHVAINTIDLATNAGSISADHAQLLLDQGLHFATNDIVTVEATGTHLTTSLRDLQRLGVDAITISSTDAVPNISFGLGDAPSLNFSNPLPSFGTDAAAHVTLEVANNTQLHQVASNISAFNTMGVDEVQLNLADQFELNQLLNDDTLSSNLMDMTINTVRQAGVDLNTIDIGGFATQGSAHLDNIQLASIIDAGLHFAAADHVTVDVNAASTYLSTHTHNLSQLGVDTVHVTDAGNFDHLAEITNSIKAAGVHTLGIDSSALDTVAIATNIDHFNWLASGVDFQLQVNSNPSVQKDIGALINLAQSDVNVITHSGTGLTSASNFGDLIHVLQSSGLSNVEVETGASVKISDDLSAALYEAGMLHALPASTFAIDIGENKVLNTSLKAMADLGVDQVVSAQTVQKLFVELGDNADITSIIAGFTHGSEAPIHGGLFGSGKEAGLVMDQTTFDQLNQGDITDLLSKLSSLGFTEIDVLKGATDTESYHIDVVAQTPVLSSTVQILGVTDANALLEVFGTDIHDKKIS